MQAVSSINSLRAPPSFVTGASSRRRTVAVTVRASNVIRSDDQSSGSTTSKRQLLSLGAAALALPLLPTAAAQAADPEASILLTELN